MPYGFSQRPAANDVRQGFGDIDGASWGDGEDGGYFPWEDSKEAVLQGDADGISGFRYRPYGPRKHCWCCCVCRRCWWC